MGLLLLLFLLPSRHYGMSVGSIDAEYVIGHTYSVIQGKRDPLPLGIPPSGILPRNLPVCY